jgi:prepilin-type N-terminal cleavage/methylation domain-containing protein
VRTRTSPAGIAEAGFTLLELIAVLAIVGLSLLLVVPRLMPPVGTRAGEVAAGLARGLLEARDDALAGARVVRVEPQALLRSLRAEDVSIEGDVVEFYPDGGSSGGGFTIAAGERGARISVDPLTGRPSVAVR